MESKMARLHPSPSPSDSHYVFNFIDMLSGSPKGQLLRIQLCLLVTTILSVLQHVVGAKRANSRVNFVAIQFIFNSLPLAITLTLGLMHNASTVHVVYPVWACALVYAHGGVGTKIVCSISDLDNSISYLLRTVPLLAWTIWLAGAAFYNGTLLQSLLLVVTLAVFATLAISNIMDTLDAFYLASKSKGLPGYVEPIDRHMRENRDVPDEASAHHDHRRSMEIGCSRYLVWLNPDPAQATMTTEDVWRLVGTRFLRGCPGVRRLRDLCLSHALFMLMLRRFADYPLHERCQPKTRRFVRVGLLCTCRDPQSLDPNRVFRVIEDELRFLFDFFYTKSRAYHSTTFRHGVGMVAVLILMLIGTFGTHILAPNSSDGYLVYSENGVDKMDITMLVISLHTLFWFRNNLDNSFSDGDMVRYLCQGLSKVGTDEEGARRIEESITKSWASEDRFSRMGKVLFGKKPWQRKLGQYSFLESYDEAPMLSRELFSPLARVARLPRVGQAGDFTVPLSDQVKRAVVASLLPHVQDEARPLSRGTSTVTRHQLWEHIPRAREYLESSSDAHVILVWHIATFFCESQSPPNNTTDDDNFLVATHLSKYCAYLLTFAPELLPGHPYTTERFFDSAVEQAKTVYTQGSDVSQMYQNLTPVEGPPVAANDNVVVWGALLARALIARPLIDQHTVWDVLAEFWAELLLYLAPSDNVAAHGEYLARGGEFITHIWALLTHAGIVARN